MGCGNIEVVHTDMCVCLLGGSKFLYALVECVVAVPTCSSVDADFSTEKQTENIFFSFQGESISEQVIPVLVRSEDSVGYAISRLVEALKMKYGERF